MVKWLKIDKQAYIGYVRRASPFIILKQAIIGDERKMQAVVAYSAVLARTETRNHTKICCVSYKALKILPSWGTASSQIAG